MKNLKINSAIELELVKNGAKNIKATKALIEMDKIQVDDKGTVIGINNQIKDLINGEDTSFLFGKKDTILNGGKPIESSDVGGNITLGGAKMSYEQFFNNYGGN